MIVTRTPFRISFFGGGTDYPAWLARERGAVLASTIDKYCWVTCRELPPFFDYKLRVVWSHDEHVGHRAEVAHPAVREVLAYVGEDRGVEIHHQGDLPARTGVGSSSAFTVGFLHALRRWRGETVSSVELARQAIEVEQERLRETVGFQDQILASHGGLVRIDFALGGGYRVTRLAVPPGRLDALTAHLVLVYTGMTRTASEIADEQLRRLDDHARDLVTMRDLVDAGCEALASDDGLEDFGRLLHETWLLKRSLSPLVSPPVVDEAYAAARRAGALGGKLLGAGGGGFLLLYVRPEERARVRESVAGLLEVPVALESSGSQVVVDSGAGVPGSRGRPER